MPLTPSRFFRFPWRSRKTIAQDIDLELGFHIEMRAAELIAKGLGATEARRRARDEFGDLESTKAYCRDLDERTDRAARTADRLAEWRQDAQYAWRTLRRSPGFAAVSLLTLALAIGANTAIFSVTRAVLLKPLPYAEPDALVRIFESWPGNPGAGTPLSPANYVDYRAQQRVFTDIAAFTGMSTVTWQPESSDPVSLTALDVTPNMFRVLRVAALHGRTYAPDADKPGHVPEVVVSYDFWQRALGGESAMVGRRIVLNGERYTVIGVMPRTFAIGNNEAIWLPLDLREAMADPVRSRKQHYMTVIGRLAPGVTIDAARAAVATIARRLELQYPDANKGRSSLILPLHDVLAGNLRPGVLLLQGAAVMVLLIACANLANLTLSRTMGRRREMALRAALGAGRGRLVRQLLTESVLLAVMGGAAGIALAMLATRALLALNPDTLPPRFNATVDGRVMLFSLALSLATGVLFGLMPALVAARADLNDALKDGGRGASGGRAGERVRRALVVAQVGLAVMLLIGAGLLVRSFGELTSVQIGFDPEHVLTAQLRTAGARYDSSSMINRFYDDVLGEIARAPGVVAVGAANVLPTAGRMGTSLRVVGEPVDETQLPDLGFINIRGDYFKALRIPLESGRLFDASDTPTSPKTAILNQAAALRFFPKGDAIGRRIRIGPDPNGEPMTVIGIVGDIRDEGLDVPAKPTLFTNHRRETWERTLNVVVRTSGDPQVAAPVIRRALKAADPTLALRDVRSLDDVVGSSLAPRRFALGLASSFAGLALLLAAIGIYGVLAYAVASRTRELGVRLALGATTTNVRMLVLRQGVVWSLLGLALGVAGALAGGRLLARMLFGVSAIDAMTYASVSIGLLVVVIVACLVPAARATRVDPLTSLRAD